jgi:hypothetical protein
MNLMQVGRGYASHIHNPIITSNIERIQRTGFDKIFMVGVSKETSFWLKQRQLTKETFVGRSTKGQLVLRSIDILYYHDFV